MLFDYHLSQRPEHWCGNKVCKLTVDGGSSMSIALQKMSNKWKLVKVNFLHIIKFREDKYVYMKKKRRVVKTEKE